MDVMIDKHISLLICAFEASDLSSGSSGLSETDETRINAFLLWFHFHTLMGEKVDVYSFGTTTMNEIICSKNNIYRGGYDFLDALHGIVDAIVMNEDRLLHDEHLYF